jgi:hypothetical protein
MSRSPSPSEQLQSSLSTSVQASLATRRPLLHHLNADSSWLLQIPRPVDETKRGRKYFNILIDPWLSGPQSDVASWFSTQWHASESKVGSIKEVEELIWRIEGRAEEEEEEVKGDRDGSSIDAVVICHEFTDHCHKDTLLELGKGVVVFATEVCWFSMLLQSCYWAKINHTILILL